MPEDIESIMSEAPGGVAPDVEKQVAAAGGFDFIDPSRLTTDAGMTAHRGTLVGDEYIDTDVLLDATEEALGYTYADVSAAYQNGRPTAEQRQLRDRIDSRLLALSRAGGNMLLLAQTLDLNEKTLDRALARARAVEVRPVVSRPAIKTPVVSFLTGLPGARPQRRRHKGCPSHMLPVDDRRYSTVNLTDDEYARGA